jgi:hypothetical protein
VITEKKPGVTKQEHVARWVRLNFVCLRRFSVSSVLSVVRTGVLG